MADPTPDAPGVNHDYAIIAVRRSDIRRYGLGPAVVLQQIRHYLDHHPELEWMETSWAELGRLCGLSVSQVRTAAGHLIEAKAVDQERRVTGQGEQKPRFRPATPGAGARSGTPGAESGTPRGARSGTPSLHSERGNSIPPLTPPGEGRQEQLELRNGPPTRGQRRAAKGGADAVLSAMHDEWRGGYPSGKQRGGAAPSLRAFARALKEDQLATLERQRDNYRAARDLYASHFVGHQAPLMNSATFLNGRRHEWDEPWTLEDCRFWPAPPGRSWELRERPRPSVGYEEPADEPGAWWQDDETYQAWLVEQGLADEEV